METPQGENVLQIIFGTWAAVAATIYYTYVVIKALLSAPRGILRWSVSAIILALVLGGVILVFILKNELYTSIFVGTLILIILISNQLLLRRVKSLNRQLSENTDSNSFAAIPQSSTSPSEGHWTEDHRIKICLLLPLSMTTGKEYILGDVSAQLEGFSKVFLNKDNLSEDFDFRILDHKNDHDRAFRLLKRHFENGVNYFVCTMSQVAIRLAGKVRDEYGTEERKPILIFTVTGTCEISDELKQENIFRFYIRINEEVEVLKAVAESHDSAGLIIIPSPYGYDIRDLFVKQWNDARGSSNRQFLDVEKDVITLPKNPTKDSLKSALKKKEIVLKSKQVLLIALYGKAVYDIVDVLHELEITPQLLLFTSTFHFINAQYSVKEILKSYQWKSCVPKLRRGYRYEEEVVKDFTYRVIYRLCETVRSLKKNNPAEFSEMWNKNEPEDLVITEDVGDSRIEMQVVNAENYD